MPSAEDLTVDNLQILFKGPFGIGKTIAACSWAVEGPIYLAYIDKKKPLELIWYKKHRPKLLANITYDQYGSNNIYKLLNKFVEFTLRGCPYVAVIIDSVTTLTSSAVNWSMGFRDIKSGFKRDPLNNEAPQTIPSFDEYKVETSMVSQLLDLCKLLPCTVIWVGHPLPQMIIQPGSSPTSVGSITKQTNIVSYGQKAGALVGGQFTEVYHFGRQVDKRIVWTDMVGDDYAKTSLFLPQNFDITNKLFYEVWKPLVDKSILDLDRKEHVKLNTPVPIDEVFDPTTILNPQKEGPNQIASDWKPSWQK